MAGNGVSGQYGDARISSTQISEVCKWNFQPKAMNPNYSSNKTGGYKVRVAGIKDGSGSIEGKYDPTNPLPSQMDVGQIVTLKLYLTAIGFYTVPAIIDSLRFMVDIDTGEFVSYTADFSTTGAWTNPGVGEQFPDGGLPEEIELDEQGNPISKSPEPKTVPAAPPALNPAALMEQVRLTVREEIDRGRADIVREAARAAAMALAELKQAA